MTRNDIHSPTNFDPAAYSYVGSFDNFPEPGAFRSTTQSMFSTEFGDVEALTPSHAYYTAARRLMDEHGAKIHFNPDEGYSQCDHCGAHIRYVVIYKHTSGEYIATGETCSQERFGCDSRREYDVKRLREAAASEREAAKSFGKAQEFIREAAPELEQWMLSPDSVNTVGGIFADIAHKLVKFGSISEKQIDFARRLLQEHYERQRNNGKTDREVQFDVEHAAAEDCPSGRVQITGIVVKEAIHESDFGETLKLTIKDDRGFLVWLTCPSSIANNVGKGCRVQMVATIEPSERDPKFGFGKRPSKAQLLDTVA